ncbi:hypothetical protein HMPREF9442_00622 [Paraprevotella xylaniphila YIT 11841]|uniref:Uncharacterized protein n=1 Tax=Paraprevotella xylaniphila YIT 11841 TaxID=762982 RepID=F3QR25_9BACT|nr:hypothetical protein HMPREF9442_00622 [Paraprevotella xylaniphila YIT 11841]
MTNPNYLITINHYEITEFVFGDALLRGGFSFGLFRSVSGASGEAVSGCV